MRLVIALGGNALLRRGEPVDAERQRHNALAAVTASIAPLATRHDIVVTHGNGPQIGLLALQAAAYRDARPTPLDLLGAESEGMIGYLIEQALASALPEREIATLLTLTEIDPHDPAFATPSKPIGPLYTEAQARRLSEECSWAIMRDGDGWRRAVPSPMPLRMREIGAIRLLLRSGVIVICAGGGGVPVAVTAEGGLRGIEAVIDKDYAAALLAESVDADRLILLTDVSGVWTRWPPGEGRAIGHATPAQLRRYSFAAGSMAPKVEAACRFVERTGRSAAIGAIGDAQAVLEGTAGTTIAPG
ncbi:MAG TPA: carbamate kinase [Stellaceae bacterium]|nr:carbamate kinase [Stellaceae bacterium]